VNEPKIDPATLALRAPPPPVTRLKRRALIAAAAGLAALVLGATLWSLQPGSRGLRGLPTELHNVERVSRAEGLEQLPADYSKIPAPKAVEPAPATTVPQLGPPMPGDLGTAMLRAEQGDRAVPGLGGPSRADAAAEAARMERASRQREAEEAAKAPLFFRGNTRHEADASSVAQRSAPAVDGNATASEAGATPTGTRNAQDEKRAFLMTGRTDASTTTSHRLESPASPYEVMAGTVIPAALITGINSDLPGQVLATVTESVYDSATGRHLLIPQGSRLIGEYDSQVAFGQRRVLLVWNRLVLPDASSMTLDRLAGADSAGVAGIEDGVDRHWRQLLAGAALSTLIGVAAELAAPDRTAGQGQVIVATRESLQDSVNQVGQQLTRNALNVQPTLTIRAGYPVRVIANKDLVLRPYQPLFLDSNRP
jgi:type IV secretion system protein VirB10